MKLNPRQILAQLKKDMDSIEQKIEGIVGSAEHNITILIDKFCELCAKGAKWEPIIAADTKNPLVQMALAYFGATSYVNGVVTILNRVAPKLQLIADDKTLFDGAIHHIAAEILVYVKDGKISIDEAVDAIQQNFLPIEVSTVLPSDSVL